MCAGMCVLQEREGPGGRGSMLQVKGLTEGKVTCAADALALIQQGQDNRKVSWCSSVDATPAMHV